MSRTSRISGSDPVDGVSIAKMIASSKSVSSPLRMAVKLMSSIKDHFGKERKPTDVDREAAKFIEITDHNTSSGFDIKQVTDVDRKAAQDVRITDTFLARLNFKK